MRRIRSDISKRLAQKSIKLSLRATPKIRSKEEKMSEDLREVEINIDAAPPWWGRCSQSRSPHKQLLGEAAQRGRRELQYSTRVVNDVRFVEYILFQEDCRSGLREMYRARARRGTSFHRKT